MKKTSNHKKSKNLKIRRDTVRQLEANQLGIVGGGCDTTSNPTEIEKTGKTALVCPP